MRIEMIQLPNLITFVIIISHMKTLEHKVLHNFKSLWVILIATLLNFGAYNAVNFIAL